MKPARKLARLFLMVAIALGASLAAPAVASGPIGTVCGQGDPLYRISFTSQCETRCPFYDPDFGCWCMKGDPIEVET